MHFKAPWSRPLIVVSIGTTVVLLAAAAAVLVTGSSESRPTSWMAASAIALLPAVAVQFTISGYTIRGSCLLIHRLWWDTRLPLHGLRGVWTSPDVLKKSFRLMGNGGLFSITGWFWNRKIGRYRAFATDPARAVVLQFRDRTVIVTPENPDAFVEAVKPAV